MERIQYTESMPSEASDSYGIMQISRLLNIDFDMKLNIHLACSLIKMY